MKIHQQEVESSDKVLENFNNKVEQLSLNDDIDGIFIYIESKSDDNKSVFIIGEVHLDVLKEIVSSNLKDNTNEVFN